MSLRPHFHPPRSRPRRGKGRRGAGGGEDTSRVSPLSLRLSAPHVSPQEPCTPPGGGRRRSDRGGGRPLPLRTQPPRVAPPQVQAGQVQGKVMGARLTPTWGRDAIAYGPGGERPPPPRLPGTKREMRFCEASTGWAAPSASSGLGGKLTFRNGASPLRRHRSLLDGLDRCWGESPRAGTSVEPQPGPARLSPHPPCLPRATCPCHFNSGLDHQAPPVTWAVPTVPPTLEFIFPPALTGNSETHSHCPQPKSRHGYSPQSAGLAVPTLPSRAMTEEGVQEGPSPAASAPTQGLMAWGGLVGRTLS